MIKFLEILWNLCFILTHGPKTLVILLIRLKDLLFRKPKKSIENALVLITGAGGGIGQLLAIEIAKLGAKPILIDINSKGLTETENKIVCLGRACRTFTCDVTDEHAIYQIASTIKDTEDRHVSIIINNAGIISDNKSIEQKSEDRIRLSFNVNAVSHFWTIKAFLPDMIQYRQGHIVNIASIAGLIGSSLMSDYVSSKFAAVGVHEALTIELHERGLSKYVRTTLVCPYFINTGMFSGVQKNKINGILPMITPEHAVNRIIDGILTNESEVYVPRTLLCLYWMKAVLPTKAALYFSHGTGTMNIMRTFTGRQADC